MQCIVISVLIVSHASDIVLERASFFSFNLYCFVRCRIKANSMLLGENQNVQLISIFNLVLVVVSDVGSGSAVTQAYQ